MQQASKKSEALLNTDKSKMKSLKKKFFTERTSVEKKKVKVRKGERVIFGLIREDSPCNSDSGNTGGVKVPSERKTTRRRKKDSCFNTGRWQPEEHQRFIEALLKFGNDWKNVQKFVGSRSSTQARSHAQKFFVKIGKTQIENLNLDFENNSLKSLNIMASKLNTEQLCRAIRNLNELAFDKKNAGRKKNDKNEKSFENDENEEGNLEILQENLNLNLWNKEERYSTTAENYCDNVGNEEVLIRRKRRIRKCKIRSRKISIICEPIQVVSHVHANTEPFMPISDEPRKYFLSNRKSSLDFSNYNFINDNSIFISNSTFKNFMRHPNEEQEFQLIFENSFKFGREERLPEESDQVQLLFVDSDGSPTCSRNCRQNTSELIEQFMD